MILQGDRKSIERTVLKKILQFNESNGVHSNVILSNLVSTLRALYWIDFWQEHSVRQELLGLLEDLRDQGLIAWDFSNNPKEVRNYRDAWDFPIRITYIGRKSLEILAPFKALERYKVFCEWYERENPMLEEKETDITQKHLAPFLFREWFTYMLTETSCPSGRIDNFAPPIGPRSDALMIEAKIFRSSQKDIRDLKNQLLSRLRDFSSWKLDEGYGVIINRSDKLIHLGNCEIVEGIFSRFTWAWKVLYFIVVNLDESFKNSTLEHKTVEIELEISE